MNARVKYKVSHTTRYDYADSVPVCQNIVYLTPRVTPFQNCLRHRLTVRPDPKATHRRTDYFGNTSHMFQIDTGHKRLQITATSTVTLEARPLADPDASEPWDAIRDRLPLDMTPTGLANYECSFPSPHVPHTAESADYASPTFAPKRPVLAAVAELNHRIYSDFEYDPTATTVNTPIEDVFANRRGVCQDLAHVMLGCLRATGLAARYVSGYLRTIPPEGQPRLVGADASHAWVSVYMGELGWVDVDPTNDTFVSTDHITLAWGRDFSDVCPVAGMFVGGGAHELNVAVDVTLV